MTGKSSESVLKTTSVLQSVVVVCQYSVIMSLEARTLRKSLDLRRLDPNTAKPYNPFDNHCPRHSADRQWPEGCSLMRALRHELRYRFLQNLDERYDHDDTKHQYPQRFQSLPAHGKPHFQLPQSPFYKLVRGPHNQRTQQIQCGVNQTRNQTQTRAHPSGHAFAAEEEDVCDDVDIDRPLRIAARFAPLLPLFFRHKGFDRFLVCLECAAGLGNAVAIEIAGVHGVNNVVCDGHHQGVYFKPVK